MGTPILYIRDGQGNKVPVPAIIGPHYTPFVDDDGVLSWTNNGELPNPDPVSIKGEVGVGVPGGGKTGQILKKRSASNYDTEWSDESGAVTSVNGQTGDVSLPIPADASDDNPLVTFEQMSDAVTAIEAKQLYAAPGQVQFATMQELLDATVFYEASGAVATPTKNDVATVLADETHSGKSARYVIASIADGTITWGIVTTFLNLTFTQAQMNAINSGMTAALRQSIPLKYIKPAGGIPASDLAPAAYASLPVYTASVSGGKTVLNAPGISMATGTIIAIVFTQENTSFTVYINGDSKPHYLRLSSADGDGSAKIPDAGHWKFAANRPYLFQFRADNETARYLICTIPRCAPLSGDNWTVSLKYGGTGANNAADARHNLGIDGMEARIAALEAYVFVE